MATTPYVLSIDDDCVLDSPGIINEIIHFCELTGCAALAWPYIDMHLSGVVQGISPGRGLWQCYTFRGCAFVVNRMKFIEAGGFRSSFIHQGEEEDFCIRLLDQGYPVLVGQGSAIHHYESSFRNWKKMDYYGSRNLILFAFFNVPLLLLPFQLSITSIKCILYGFKLKRPYQKALGVWHGIMDGFRLLKSERKPVRLHTFRTYRMLKKNYRLYKLPVPEN
jgi:GT2 family glycosyltransferase